MTILTAVKFSLRTVACVLLTLLGILVLTEVSPIYNFEEGKAFSGPDIYNPYACLDSTLGWTRTNLHTHTHATKWINECELYPDSVRYYYDKLGYGLESFSNHMELTPDPDDTTGQIWVYEQGYNIAKHHNLVFGAKKVNYYDSFLPVMVSQKQFKMDVVSKGADFIFFNHPDRTEFTNEKDMSELTGYRLLEADCRFIEKGTYGEKWDMALSNGHYVPSALSDDLHNPKDTKKIARRTTFLNCKSTDYEDVKQCLLSGDFYTAHIPDFGDGDWDVKIAANENLPSIVSIGLKDGDDVYMTLSKPADTIQVVGQNGVFEKTVSDTTSVDYEFKSSDSYIRLVARYDDGTVLMTNPFARWDEATSTTGTPYRTFAHPVNWLLTILYNLAVILIGVLLIRQGFRTLKTKK